MDIFTIALSLVNEHNKIPNLLGIVTWPVLGKQYQQVKRSIRRTSLLFLACNCTIILTHSLCSSSSLTSPKFPDKIISIFFESKLHYPNYFGFPYVKNKINKQDGTNKSCIFPIYRAEMCIWIQFLFSFKTATHIFYAPPWYVPSESCMYACILLAVLSLAEIRVKQPTRHKWNHSNINVSDKEHSINISFKEDCCLH